jgi:hypothetical protein
VTIREFPESSSFPSKSSHIGWVDPECLTTSTEGLYKLIKWTTTAPKEPRIWLYSGKHRYDWTFRKFDMDIKLKCAQEERLPHAKARTEAVSIKRQLAEVTKKLEECVWLVEFYDFGTVLQLKECMKTDYFGPQ